jgi:hypothetical protein
MASSTITARRQLARLGGALLVLALVALALGRGAAPGRAAEGWRWYKVDTHVHSSVSADATSDVGIHTRYAVRAGYDAIFLTDHDGGSSFHINGQSANSTRCCAPLPRPDPWDRWRPTSVQATSEVNGRVLDGPFAGALRLMKQSAGSYAETGRYTDRGPNLRSGRITMTFEVYPTRLDPGAGVYVSASFGGDPLVQKTTDGYTTAAGVVSPGKSTVMVWQLGSARASSADPDQRVLAYSLGPPVLNTWTSYTVDVTQAIADIPAADLPMDHNGLVDPKMAVAATEGGTAEAYFRNLTINAAAPEPAASEFVNRTGFVGNHDTPTFRVFPSYEMGQQKHTQRFNFGITDTSQYRTYPFGTDGIAEAQQSGYPAQANHPGSTITVQETIDTAGNGADLLEVRHQPWVDAWDQILLRGTQILGVWSTDTHTGVGSTAQAAYVYAPALEFDPLVRSLFEGRFYNAIANFAGNLVLRPESAAPGEPYPARYPVYVPEGQTSADARLAVSAGLTSGNTVVWVRNGVPFRTDAPTGPGYDQTVAVPLGGPSTYVRAEVRSAGGNLRALTQPVFFVAVPGLPAGRSFHVERVVTANGRDYTKLKTKGITAAQWDGGAGALLLSLENPAGALVTGRMTTPAAPARLTVDGLVVPVLASSSALEAAGASAWYYDAAAQQLHWKARHAAATASVVVEFSAAADTQPPTVPTGLTAAARAGGVDLAWAASSDDAGVVGYSVYRDGVLVANVGGGLLAYTDTSVVPGVAYAYAVDAVDAAGNRSAQSGAAGATGADTTPTATATPTRSPTATPTPTATPARSTALPAAADAYVDGSAANAGTNYGASSVLRVDASPALRAYLRFDVPEPAGPLRRARLRLVPGASHGVGFQVRRARSDAWDELAITAADQPGADAAIAGVSGPLAAGVPVEIDVTSLVTGGGPVSFVLTTTTVSSIVLVSREGAAADAPALIDGDAYRDRHPDPDAERDPHPELHADRHLDRHRDPDGHGDSDADRYPDADAIRHPHADAFAHRYVHADAFAHRYVHADAHRHPDRDPVADADGYADADGDAHRHADPHANGHPDAHGDGDA